MPPPLPASATKWQLLRLNMAGRFVQFYRKCGFLRKIGQACIGPGILMVIVSYLVSSMELVGRFVTEIKKQFVHGCQLVGVLPIKVFRPVN